MFSPSDLSSDRILKPEPSEIHDLETFQKKKKNCPERDGKLQFDLICPEFCTSFTHYLSLSHPCELCPITHSSQHDAFNIERFVSWK